jgi:formylmethanofuran dehydrogenase subunit D
MTVIIAASTRSTSLPTFKAALAHINVTRG